MVGKFILYQPLPQLSSGIEHLLPGVFSLFPVEADNEREGIGEVWFDQLCCILPLYCSHLITEDIQVRLGAPQRLLGIENLHCSLARLTVPPPVNPRFFYNSTQIFSVWFSSSSTFQEALLDPVLCCSKLAPSLFLLHRKHPYCLCISLKLKGQRSHLFLPFSHQPTCLSCQTFWV